MSVSAERHLFVGIGGQKCATTWTADCLRSHPEVGMPAVKELHYFSYRYNRADREYLDRFPWGLHRVCGEFSTSYLYEPEAPTRIARLGLPTTLILNLRNPVDRLLSHRMHLVRDGVLTPEQDVRESIRARPDLVTRGRFGEHLEPFLDQFGRQALVVLLQEDIAARPYDVLRELYGALNVAPDFTPPGAEQVVSKGIVPRIQFLEDLRRGIYSLLRESPVPGLTTLVHRSPLPRIYRRFNGARSERGSDAELRRELWSCFEADVIRLESLLGLSLLNRWAPQ